MERGLERLVGDLLSDGTPISSIADLTDEQILCMGAAAQRRSDEIDQKPPAWKRLMPKVRTEEELKANMVSTARMLNISEEKIQDMLSKWDSKKAREALELE